MRRVAALLLGLMLTGCSGHGAEGVAVPPPTDFAHFVRPGGPHTALAAPAGFTPAPDIVTPVYHVPAAVLFAVVGRVAGEQVRTYPLVGYPGRLQARWVVRSATINFPDVVTADVVPDGEGASRLILFSTSVYGYYDFGVNRARLRTWLAGIDRALAALPQP